MFKSAPTQLWSRPPGVNHLLINPGVQLFYKFFCGSSVFPAQENITPDIDFFNRQSIQDGLFLNPPYDPALLDLIIAKLVRFAYTELKTFAVLLPFSNKQIIVFYIEPPGTFKISMSRFFKTI